MSLINTLHMAAREERFTEDSNAPITDGSHCWPIIPFCAHPPVFCEALFFSSLVFCSWWNTLPCGRSRRVFSWEMHDQFAVAFTLCLTIFVWRLPQETDVNTGNELLMWFISSCKKLHARSMKKNIKGQVFLEGMLTTCCVSCNVLIQANFIFNEKVSRVLCSSLITNHVHNFEILWDVLRLRECVNMTLHNIHINISLSILQTGYRHFCAC